MITKKLKGFSLIELMITMLLSLVILLGVIQIVLASQTNHLFQNQMASIQENLRYAMNEVGTQIKNAHILPIGCESDVAVANLTWDEVRNASEIKGAVASVYSFKKDSSAWLNKYSKAKEGADVLVLRQLEVAYSIKEFSQNKWYLEGGITIPKDNTVLMESRSCTQISLFNASFLQNSGEKLVEGISILKNVEDGESNCTEHLYGDFYCTARKPALIKGEKFPVLNTDDFKIYPIEQNIFYVGDSTQKDANGEFYPALYRNKEELIQGVEFMYILLGVDLNFDGVPNQYIVSEKMDDELWESVVSVKIELTMRSLEKIPSIKSLSDDQYLRETISQVFKIRSN